MKARLIFVAILVAILGGCTVEEEAPPSTDRQESGQSLVGEEVAVEDIPAINGVRIFYYTPDDKVETLLAIAEKYKGQYGDKASVEILYFNNRQNTPQALPMNDFGVACHVAKFEWIPSQGTQVLQRKKDGWKELNQGL